MSNLLRRAFLMQGVGGGGINIADIFSIDLWAGDSVSETVITDIDAVANDTLTWIKGRDIAASNHVLVDTVRGATETLASNSSTIEATIADSLTTFNNDGYSLGSFINVNQNFAAFVGWTWRKSPKFFDVVTYIGDGVAGKEIPHSLGVQAGMCMVKKRGAVGSWWVQHIARGGTSGLRLELVNVETVTPTLWNDTTMDDSKVTLGDFTDVNSLAGEYVMYVFAHDPSPEGVIQCGTYTGNGNAVGPTISLGWKPQFIMVKAAFGFSNGSWLMADTQRGLSYAGGAGTDQALGANLDLTEAQTGSGFIALNADGFRLTSTNGSVNSSGAEYIYMAIKDPIQPVNTIGEYVNIPIGATGIIISVKPPFGRRCKVTTLNSSNPEPDMEVRMGSRVLITGAILDDRSGARGVNTFTIGKRTGSTGDQPYIVGEVDETFELEKLSGSTVGAVNYSIDFVI